MSRTIDFDDGFTSETPSTVSTTLASEVVVTPSGNLASTDGQSAFVELQTDIDTRATSSALTTHTSDTANPHAVTKTQVGLGNVDNTSDATKNAAVATLTNKTLTSPVISTISNTGTLTLPTSTDTLVGRATTDTLTNKTLTSPIISSISNTGTLTLPTSTDTLVGRATTDTLTNKTINGSNNTITNVSLSTGVTGILPLANGGTGQSTKAPAFDALSPMTTSGDVIYGGASGTATRLAKGSDGQVLTLASGLPSWASPGAATPTLIIQQKSATYTALSTDDVIECSGASWTLTLYTAVGNSGKQIRIVHAGTSLTQVYTLNTTSAQTIGGIASGSYILYTNGEALTLYSDGSNWKILNHKTDTGWVNAGTCTVTAETTNPTKSAAMSIDKIEWMRQGDTAHFNIIQKWTTAGSGGSGGYIWALPTNMTAAPPDNTSILTTDKSLASSYVGQMFVVITGGSQALNSVYARSTTSVAAWTNSVGRIGSANFNMANADTAYSFQFKMKISGWQP